MFTAAAAIVQYYQLIRVHLNLQITIHTPLSVYCKQVLHNVLSIYATLTYLIVVNVVCFMQIMLPISFQSELTSMVYLYSCSVSHSANFEGSYDIHYVIYVETGCHFRIFKFADFE